ncbi:MAG TPA: DUF6634 family protein [Methylocystis sp.]|jgi:hypothetical protein
MNSPFFFDHSADAAISHLRALADDLARIRDDGGPSDADLADAPILDRWVPISRMRPALAGMSAGHPLLGDRLVQTSETYAVDFSRGWTRTYSRFYRLGRPAGASRGRDQ